MKEQPKEKEIRLPARDGKTPSNYIQNEKGEVWYKPLPPKTKPELKKKGGGSGS